MPKLIDEYYYAIKSKLRNKLNTDPINKKKFYAGVPCVDEIEMNNLIKEKIISGEPFMAARYGGTELFAMGTTEFDRKDKLEKAVKNMDAWSGFFPADAKLLYKFNEIILNLS